MSKLPAGFTYTNRTVHTVAKEFGITGPVCHVGSLLNGKPEGSAKKLRAGFAAQGLEPFIGVDIFQGQNVDVQADLCAPDLFEDHPELEGQFALVYCSAVLEHVKLIFECAKNIRRLIRPGGHLYFVGPWVQGFHGYPDDYWRISFSGLQVLFPDLEWKAKWYGGTIEGLTIDFDSSQDERKAFQIVSPQPGVSLTLGKVSDRAMSFLLIGALGQVPEA